MPSLADIRVLLQSDIVPHLSPHGLFPDQSSSVSQNPSNDQLRAHLSIRSLVESGLHPLQELVARINVPLNGSSSAAQNASALQDPFSAAGQYSLAWTYFCVVILAAALALHIYRLWTDKIRRALHKENAENVAGKASLPMSPDDDYEMYNLKTNNSVNRLFPRGPAPTDHETDIDSALYVPMVDKIFALVRWVIYRPIKPIRFGKRRQFFPSIGVILISLASLALVVVYSLVPRPLFYQSISFGSPPLAIRAGMFSVATIPWIIAISMKANFVSVLTGLGHERLNVLHRWLGYICLVLALIHVIPFYITPVWKDGAEAIFRGRGYFWGVSYPYTTGLAAFASLVLLCTHSLSFIRSRMYELFVIVHTPLSVVFLGFMFWHCGNALISWSFLWATVGIWVGSLIFRLYYQNWVYFWRNSFLCGEESAITILPENAVKITIPSQMKWKPGQFVYLRMPGISFLENHPFTIASLCSDDFMSEYGDAYRDMVLVFRPFSGFTRKVVEAHDRYGPSQTYRAFLDGPYGGMQRELISFDTVVFIAGGSGITAIISHLLLLIKKMREGSAVTKQVHVIWAMRRPETAEWFKEELRICRQFAPPDSVHCQFFITAAKRVQPDVKTSKSAEKSASDLLSKPTGSRPNSYLHEKVNDAFQGIASKRNSALIREAAGGDPIKEKQLLAETEDEIRPMPQAFISPPYQGINDPAPTFSPPPKRASSRPQQSMHLTLQSAPQSPSQLSPTTGKGPAPNFSRRDRPMSMKIEIPTEKTVASFDFGFPSTPTVLQKSLMRFAFMPGLGTNAGSKRGWHTEYGRPDIPYMLRQLHKTEFSKRNCIFVCGPSSMRIDVQQCVAGLQSGIWNGNGKVDEIFMHTENYSI
ncbi:MAG: hypothetical protein GOMPHAMPRED_004835 [Gomphillus americanus]|uniref:ferric-chelate reductase (NADPH) n=1 Tax=Gomphillus americanus TaxID=1940652 RepID=A0A8H3I7Y3_9LECA|nr:MAG: hypothetical protein GOMPHAMPRED_004835 [Gomphillus americanus]